jgi:hypothetical protein
MHCFTYPHPSPLLDEPFAATLALLLKPGASDVKYSPAPTIGLFPRSAAFVVFGALVARLVSVGPLFRFDFPGSADESVVCGPGL